MMVWNSILRYILVLVAAGFGFAASAVAQDASETEKRQELLEEIVVRGVKGSISNALQAKRSANKIVDAIFAEDIGKLPDHNLAEALHRLPGVSLQRSQGQGKQISIRGLGPGLNLTLFDGRPFAGASRTFNYNTVASEIVGSLTVVKSPSADTIEGGVGGVVNVYTRKPLDLDPMTVSTTAAVQRIDISGEYDSRVSGLISNKSEDGRFGALLSVGYSERTNRWDSVDVAGWADLNFNVVDDQRVVIDSIDDIAAPANIQQNIIENPQERFGANFVLQSRPNQNTTLGLEGVFTRLKTTDGKHYQMFWAGAVRAPRARGRRLVLGLESDNNPDSDNATPAYRDNGAVRRLELFPDVWALVGLDLPSDNEAYLLAANSQWTGNQWSIDGDISFSESDVTSSVSRVISRRPNHTGRVYEFNGTNLPRMTSDVPLTDATGLFQFANSLDDRYGDSSALSARINLARSIDRGWLTNVVFGARYADLESDNSAYLTGIFIANNGQAFPSEFLSPFPGGGGFMSGVGGDFERDFLAMDVVGYHRFLDEQGLLAEPTLNPSGTTRVAEDSLAGYVRFDLEGQLGAIPMDGNIGVRVARTEQLVDGFTSEFRFFLPPDGISDVITRVLSDGTELVVEKDYTDVLPSLNLRLDLKDDLLLRLAAAKVIARAGFSQMSTRIGVRAAHASGSAGNPEIEPYRANQYDVSLEWYPTEYSAIAVAGFYKDVGNYIVGIALEETIPGVIVDPANDLPSANVFVNRPRNGGDAKIRGVELSVTHSFDGQLPAPVDGLGVQANYTYIDSSTSFQPEPGIEDSFPFPGLSQHTYNIIAFYEKSKWSVRLAYDHRSEYLISPSAQRGNAIYGMPYGQLDASLSYSLTDSFTVYLNAINLTNNDVRRYADVPGRFSRYSHFGTVVSLNVRGNFSKL